MKSKNIKKVLLLIAVTILLVGLVSATTSNKTNTKDIKVIKDNTKNIKSTPATTKKATTKTVTNNKTKTNKVKEESSEKKTQKIEKKHKNTKTETRWEATSWSNLQDQIGEVSEDTTIKLNERSSFLTTDTITWNKPGITLTIDGNGQAIKSYKIQVFRIEEGSTLIIKNITITNAETTEEERGGAIYNNGNLTISDSTLENNTAILTVYDRAYGGAIYNNGNLNITHTTFTNNTAKTKGLTYSGPCAYGGAIYNNGNLNITFSTLTNNTVNALDTSTGKECYADGGAIYNNGTLTITHTTLQNNHATATKNNENAYARGGAIYNNKNLNITDTTLTNNEVTATTTGIDVYSHAYGGAIYNERTLNITQTTLENNLAKTGNYENGGAIYNAGGTLTINNSTISKNTANDEGAITNYGGFLTITYSTLQNNQAQVSGGAITCYRGSLTITHSTLENNKAQQGSGGAIKNEGGLTNINNCNLTNNTAKQGGGAIHLHYGNLNINGSQLKYNNAPEGGAISRRGGDFVITNSSLSDNHATEQAGAIYSNYDGTCNITGNTFTENTADNNETIVLDRLQDTLLKDNIYQSTAISLNTIELSVKDNKELFNFGEDIVLNYSLVLEHPNYYDQDILERLEDITIYFNDEKYYTTKYENYTLSNILPGTYTVYYKTCKKQSNTVAFNIPIVDSEIITSESAYDFYDGLINNVTIKINDKTGENGTLNISVKNGDEYYNLLSYNDIKDEYNLTTERLADELKTLYANLDDSYTLNVTYTNDYVVPSSTEFTLNIIKQRNTSIIYNILNNTEGNVQISITVIDTIYKTPISNAKIQITGAINKNTTTGIITDKTLKNGDHKITIKYEKMQQYLNTTTTINFKVEIDKDKKIKELENEVKKLTQKTKTQVTINTTTATVGKKVTIKVTVKDADGKAVTGGKVSLKVNGKLLKDSNSNIIYADVSRGVASIKYLVPGSWITKADIEAIYTGNYEYNDSTVTKSGIIKVQKGSTTITLTPNIETLKAGQKVTINVKHIDTNTKQGLTSKVAVKVNGKTYKVEVKNGEGKLTYTIPEGMNAKTLQVTASHSSKYYNKATSKTSFKVTKTTPTIKTTKTTTKAKKTTIKGKILDANNKALTKNVKVTVKVDGKIVLKNKVVKKGKINLSFKKSLKKGYHELVITSKANKAFNKASYTSVLKV